MTHARNQDGFALIEVIVSAAVLAIIALAVLSGIDGATASTARERARAVAASLAEQDQERMRGYRFNELANIPQQPDQVVDGVTYSVKSVASWVVDDGTVSGTCGTSGTKQSEYLRIVTTVTSSMVGSRIDPIKMESLVAAPVSGSLAVKVEPGVITPARVANVVGLLVTAIAKADNRTLTANTDAQGCAIFRGIESGNYTVRLNTSGYVDKQGNQLSEAEGTVNPGLVSVVGMTYDRAVTININVVTLKPGTPFSTSALTHPSKVNAVSDNAADRDVLRTFTPSSPSSTVTAAGLFPFNAAYSFFAGKCVTESPVTVGNKDYFTQTNKAAAVLGDPTVFQPQTATVYEPAFNIRIKADSTGTVTNAADKVRAWVWLQNVGSESCDEYRDYEMTVMSWPGGTWGAAPVSNQANGYLSSATSFDPGMPFGSYKICLYDKDKKKWWGPKTYDNKNPNGQATTTELPDSVSWGSANAVRPSACAS